VNEIDEIRQEMARIRHDLHEDVSGVVGGASDVMDWRSHLKAHPWISGGVALLVGYYLVPRRTKSSEIPPSSISSTVQPIMESSTGVVPRGRTERRKPLSAWRLIGWAVSFVGPIALNATQAYASVWLENQLGIRPKDSDESADDGRGERGVRSPRETRSGMTSSGFGSPRGAAN
jgi:hypothetical protein